MKYSFSKTVLTAWEEKIQAGNYRGLHVRLAGTNLGGQTLAKGDLGNLYMTLNGEQIHFAPDDWLSDMNNQFWGYNEFTSAVGAAFTYGIYLPFHLPGFPNALTVKPDDTLTLGFQPAGTVATKVSSWAIDINTVESNEPEKYIPRFLPAYESAAAATVIKRRINNKNIYAIWITGANLTRVQVERDGELLHEAAYASLLSQTSLFTEVEAALATYIYIPLGDQVSDFLSEAVDVQITASGASSPKILYCSIDADPTRRSRSAEILQNKLIRRVEPIRANSGRSAEMTTILSTAKTAD